MKPISPWKSYDQYFLEQKKIREKRSRNDEKFNPNY